ncbi:MAG TPA: hypothetical protein VHB30_11030, partial [Solirubrobacteraceae bacterium]|nr:hypothetical protein [Solirubrobacteraceae bacterium]
MTIAERLAAADLAATRELRTLPHSPAGDVVLGATSRATDDALGWVVAGLAAAALDRPRRARWLAATATVVLADRASV